MLKTTIILILLFSLSGFCEKKLYLPEYLPQTRVDDDVREIINKQDSVFKQIDGRLVQKKAIRDILGRLSEDTTIYVLRDDLMYGKKIPVGIVDLTSRNRSTNPAIEFQKNREGRKFVRLNGKEISLEEYHSVKQTAPSQDKEPFIRYDTLNVQEIKKLMSGTKPVHIFLHKNPSVELDDNYYYYSIIFNFSGLTSYHSAGVKGDGVGLFYEENCPDAEMLNNEYFVQSGTCSDPESHSTKVAKLLQLTAPEAVIVNFKGFNAVIPNVQNNANRYNPHLEIGSYSWHYILPDSLKDVYHIKDQELDQHIYEDRLIYFVAAGNMSDTSDIYVTSPGKALNAITVGAVHPATQAYTDYSKWRNSEIRNQKPEIANYTNFYFDNITFNGTSASTPYSAAIAALILSADSDLKRHPEVIKSIFLMNATNSISNAQSHDTDDTAFVASKMPYFNINDEFVYRWWSGSNDDFFDSNDKIIFTETGITSGQHCRAAISWLNSGSYVGEYKLLAQDLDLYVYQGSTPLASSATTYNPFEVVDFTTQSNANLRIEIRRYANSFSDDIVLGFTMRCNND